MKWPGDGLALESILSIKNKPVIRCNHKPVSQLVSADFWLRLYKKNYQQIPLKNNLCRLPITYFEICTLQHVIILYFSH